MSKELAAAQRRGSPHPARSTLPSAGTLGCLVITGADSAAVSTSQTWRGNAKAKLAFS